MRSESTVWPSCILHKNVLLNAMFHYENEEMEVNAIGLQGGNTYWVVCNKNCFSNQTHLLQN